MLASWLDLPFGQLAWFADCQRRTDRSISHVLRHYRARWIPKRGGRWRLLEIPKDRLKAIQTRILREILDHVPPHDAAHAYRAGRSVLTYAQPHVGRAMALRFDLRDYFPSIPGSRVHALFRVCWLFRRRRSRPIRAVYDLFARGRMVQPAGRIAGWSK